jgi:hypothetical protein
VGRGDDEDENPERDGKVWFKPGEKRKVAFLKGEVSAGGGVGVRVDPSCETDL